MTFDERQLTGRLHLSVSVVSLFVLNRHHSSNSKAVTGLQLIG